MEICDVLPGLLIRPSFLPNGRSLGDTADLHDLPFDEWRMLARSDGSGSGICSPRGWEKYLIGRAGQKQSNKCYLADSDNSQQFRHFTMPRVLPSVQRGFTCIGSQWAKTVAFGRLLSGGHRLRACKGTLPRYPNLQGRAAVWTALKRV